MNATSTFAVRRSAFEYDDAKKSSQNSASAPSSFRNLCANPAVSPLILHKLILGREIRFARCPEP